MITREEYNKALDIVETYNKQLFIGVVGSSLRDVGKTKLNEWDKLNECSTRLYRILTGFHRYNKTAKNYYIEDLTNEEWSKFYLAGAKGWREFIELRGY